MRWRALRWKNIHFAASTTPARPPSAWLKRSFSLHLFAVLTVMMAGADLVAMLNQAAVTSALNDHIGCEKTIPSDAHARTAFGKTLLRLCCLVGYLIISSRKTLAFSALTPTIPLR